MKNLNTIKNMILILTLVFSFSSQALDFEKEIAKQEVTVVQLQQDLLDKDKDLKPSKKDSKKQDLQVVLIPKTRRN